MPPVSRVLDEQPVPDLDTYAAAGGGSALKAALRLGPAATIEEMEASGLRGRGGAGFPTGRKWRTVAEHASDVIAATVVVNASEGEPGSFKDRMLLRRNPYRILEGALVAAHTVRADSIVVALKASFHPELARLRRAIDEIETAGWTTGVGLAVCEGPSEYLYGEETALLEVLDGRAPFPRIAPPFRHGVEELGTDPVSAAGSMLADPGPGTPAPPTLVNNAETMAQVALVLAHGPAWYRELGTPDSPGTAVCTVSGSTRRHGVGEFPMGTPLCEVIEALGGGPRHGPVRAVLSGVAHPLLSPSDLDAPVSYEGMESAGSGLGAAGFIVFDESDDLVAVAQGVARFLAVESCGQCTPCKQDGLAIAEILDRLCRSEATEHDLTDLADRAATVTDESRCYLATQQQRVVGSLLRRFPESLAVCLRDAGRPPVDPVTIAPIVDLDGERATIDESNRRKQPDWTYDEDFSGQSPADRIDQRAPAAR
ncbi:MAG: NADH-ubiquinone oxidoreductase-F iron-sulfur binding region domain-containing protein [Acidimicrobiia bacterium]